MATSTRGRLRKGPCEPFTSTLIHLYGESTPPDQFLRHVVA